MRRGRLALAIGAVVWVALMAVVLWPPQRLDGAGTLYGDFQCVGIKFDSGQPGGPVTNWPRGLRAERVGDEWAVIEDSSGREALREGDRVTVKAHLTHAEGDTSCLNTRIITVESVELLDREQGGPKREVGGPPANA